MGFLPGRYELMDGEIIEKMSKNRPHVVALVLLAVWLDRIFGSYFVQRQDPIIIPIPDDFSTEPEPDIAVTKAPASAYASDSPGAEDVLFIAEVSDTTLTYDLGYKANLYAAAGIPEYWVLDVVGRRMHVHRLPSEMGYREITIHGENEQVATLARPEDSVSVSAMLPETPK
jgi:Uma2 family endonuclease